MKQTQGSVSPAAVKRRRTDGGHSQPRPRVLLIEPFYGGSHQQLADLLHKHITSTLEWPVQLLTLRDKKVCGQRPAHGADLIVAFAALVALAHASIIDVLRSQR